jgi:hypothetical protein
MGEWCRIPLRCRAEKKGFRTQIHSDTYYSTTQLFQKQ